MQNQYEQFYLHLKSFSETIGLASKDCFSGVSEKEIIAFEVNNNVVIGEEFRIALKILGKKTGFCLMSTPPSLKSLNDALELEKEFREEMELEPTDISWKEEIKKVASLDKKFSERYVSGEPIILDYIEELAYLEFTYSNSKELIIYGYSLDSKRFIKTTPFIVEFRKRLVNMLIILSGPKVKHSYYIAYEKYITNSLLANLKKIPWLIFTIN